MTPKPSPKPRTVHDAFTVPESGLTPCCSRDPRSLAEEAFTADAAEVTCAGAEESS